MPEALVKKALARYRASSGHLPQAGRDTGHDRRELPADFPRGQGVPEFRWQQRTPGRPRGA